MAPNANFFIHAGDLVDKAHSESEWNEWFTAGSFIHSEIPAIVVPGNHEYQRTEIEQQGLGRISLFNGNLNSLYLKMVQRVWKKPVTM